jgi:long-chain acyl-CoA synthetase
MKLGTVGEPYPGIGFRIAEGTGEIQTKHDGVFAGYWNKPDKTAETMTDDGWLMTGDVGEWVDGTHVRIVDRIKHIIITSGGKNISPSEIENSLKTSPYVKEAMVIGEGRKYLDRADRHRARHRRRLGAAQGHPVHHLPRPVREARGDRADPGRRRPDNEKFARVENIRKFGCSPRSSTTRTVSSRPPRS